MKRTVSNAPRLLRIVLASLGLGFLPLLASAQLVREQSAARSRHTITGRACLPDGSPAANVVVVTSAGGRAITAADGSFELEVEITSDERSLDVTVTGASDLTASVRVLPAALSRMDSSAFALGAWDDGDGPALYVGGDFLTSPAGDSYLAKWGCRPKTTAKQRKF